jgi:conjugative transfer signal peptidase TraF
MEGLIALKKENNTPRRKAATFLTLITLFLLFASALALCHSAGYRISLSTSLPGRVYRITALGADEPLRVGDRLLIDLSRLHNPVIDMGMERGYIKMHMPMLKEVGALPGDTIELRGGMMYVNGSPSRMAVASADAAGRKLPAWPTPVTLRKNEYWMVSNPDYGFDSRYFGPVSRGAFTHRGQRVF